MSDTLYFATYFHDALSKPKYFKTSYYYILLKPLIILLLSIEAILEQIFGRMLSNIYDRGFAKKVKE